jgi:hypothetical protein
VAAADEIASARRRAIETATLVGLALGFVVVCWVVPWTGKDAPSKMSWEGWGIFVGAGLTLIMYSFLYRDNALFKAAENLYVGVTLGYGAVMTWRLSLKPEIIDVLFLEPPNLRVFFIELSRRIVPIILGCLLLTRLSPRHAWLSRYAYVIMVGWGAGIGIPITVHSYILQQLEPVVQPLPIMELFQDGAAFWPIIGATAGQLVILVGTVTVLFYFFFSVEHKGAAGGVSRVGVIFLMVSFGASFGYTVMGRVSLLIGRVQFLIENWLGLGP